MPGTSLLVQWLRLHTSNSGVMGSIPGWETKIPSASPEKKKSEIMPLLNQLVCFQWLMSGTPSLFYFQRLLDPCRHVSYVRRPQETHQSPENYQPLADWRVRFKLCFAQMNDSCRLSICLLCWAFQSFPNPALLPEVPWQEALLLTILWTHSTTFVFVSSTESPFYWILPILTPSCPKAIITFFFFLFQDSLHQVRACMRSCFSRVWVFCNSKTIARQAPLSLNFIE